LDTANSDLKDLNVFREINKAFPKTKEILKLKRNKKKIFGWLCTYVPEEIIHAAGALPIRITGYSREVELDDGNAYMYINNCSFSRSCMQLGLRGEYDYLDGIIAGSTCDGARRLFDLWVHYIKPPFHHILSVPRKYTESAHVLYYDQIKTFKQRFEDSLGIKITDDALLYSIDVYNESRKLLKQLYDLRKLEKPLITGTQTMEVCNASFRMSKEQFNHHLSLLIEELLESKITYSGRARLMVIGSVMDNPEFIHSIEDVGALVVTDELCTSTRYWSDPVVLNWSPLESISRRYLNNFPCARMVPSDGRFDRIIQLAKEYKVDGVISQTIRYCVPYAHDVPLVTERLKQVGIPTLSLDVEYGTSGSGQIRTRVQAFLEMLETR
jgi:bzd-type benzoyl-CoA reductase N subunit